jgi:hypothetical protein
VTLLAVVDVVVGDIVITVAVVVLPELRWSSNAGIMTIVTKISRLIILIKLIFRRLLEHRSPKRLGLLFVIKKEISLWKGSFEITLTGNLLMFVLAEYSILIWQSQDRVLLAILPKKNHLDYSQQVAVNTIHLPVYRMVSIPMIKPQKENKTQV